MAALPHALEQRLAALVPRVRALRVVSGLSLCLLAAVTALALVLVLDALVGLPASARGLFIAVWVTALGVLVWHAVVRPWQAAIPLSDVARELEKRLPEFGERLQAVMGEGAAGKSEAVKAALAEDTARRAKAVDFVRAIPAHPALLRVCGALLALLGFLVATGLVPGSAERLRRVALPWARPPGAGVRVVVTSGEPVVRRGGPVTLAAYAQKTDARSAAPDGATLVVRDHAGAAEQRLPMSGDGAGAFHATRPDVSGDFEYRVEVGGATSEWFRVTALDAVEPADGTRAEVVPPAYTRYPKATRPGFTDLDVLQHSDINLQLKFTRPAASAQLEWQPNGEAKSYPIPVELSPDRLGATATFRAPESGGLRLILVSEADGKRLRTVTTVSVRVTPDRAPWFEQVSGVTSRPRTARPDARVPVAFVAGDDMNVSDAVLEYVLDLFDSRPETLRIPLAGGGSPLATGSIDFDLAPLARATSTIRFRVRVTDNRTDADKSLAPQAAFYPASGWSELRFAADAPPLGEQDIRCQHDAVHDPLGALAKDVKTLAAEAQALGRATSGAVTLAVDHTVRLNTARERVRAAAVALSDLARETALTPDLRPLAAVMREVSDRQLKAAGDALREADTDDPTARAETFRTAAKHLTSADAALTDLLARNAKLSRERLDRARLGTLAADQAALADAAKTGGVDLLARQRELLARLNAVLADSASLRAVMERAKGDEINRVALALAELAAQLRDLDAAARKTATDARDALVADIAHDQEELTKRAAKLFAAVDTAARLVGVAPPKLGDFRRVAELAAAGKAVEALTELEKQAQALERLAGEFDKWAAERADAKRGAKHLALWQDDLFTRFRSADFDKLPADAKATFRDEQKALHAALGALALPPDAAVRTARDNAAKHTGLANAYLAGDGRGADAAMKAAADSLHRLADKTPSVGERLTKTRGALDTPRLDQEMLSNAVDLALRAYDGQAPAPATVAAIAKKLAPLVERQRKVQAAIAALDLPGLGDRQARMANALAVAVADLQDGSPFDVQASQAAVRRELERLKLALDGLAPPDAKADELHQKLAALADSLDAHGATVTAKQLEPAAPVVQDALKQLPALAVEAPVLLNDARAALQSADAGFRDGAKPPEVRRRVRAAADALEKLRARLYGFEPDLERIQRLTNNRRFGAARAKELADAKAPFSAPASDEMKRQLGREVDELTHTRVGAAGQVHKRRALDLYARLRLKTEPDRFASDHAALAEALDELAAKTADIAELATAPPSAEPPAPPAADMFLPSKPLAGALRDLASEQRTVHDHLTNFTRALTKLLGGSNAATTRQVARAGELAARAAETARVLELAAKGLDPLDATAKALAEAARQLKDAEKQLHEAARKAAAGDIGAAAQLRGAADTRLRGATERVAGAVPAGAGGPNTAPGAALRAAELAMRKAVDDLAPGGTPGAAEQAMRAAASALTAAGGSK